MALTTRYPMELQIIDHSHSVLHNPTDQAKKELLYTQKTYNRLSRKWTKMTYSVRNADGLIFTGLVPRLQALGAKIDNDYRQPCDFPFFAPNLTVDLRAYQIDFLIEALKRKRMIIKAATGSGKTIIMAAIMEALHQDTLIMVPDKTIQGQLGVELNKLLPPGGSNYDILIDIPRNLYKRNPVELQKYKVLMADECHNYAAQQAMDTIQTWGGGYRFGFSGTPTGRGDNRDLFVEGLFGPIVELIDPAELVEQGYLARTHVDMHFASWDGDYVAMEDMLIVHNTRRNALIKQLSDNNNGTKLILVRRIDHGYILQDMIRGSVFVHGDTSMKDREAIREKVKSGKLKVLIASGVFGSGLDIPNLEVGINAGGGKAEILTLQKAGRVRRPFEGIPCKRWIDIYDGWNPTLDNHSKLRYELYVESGLPVSLHNFSPVKEDRVKARG